MTNEVAPHTLSHEGRGPAASTLAPHTMPLSGTGSLVGTNAPQRTQRPPQGGERCTAKSKQTGRQCGNWALKDRAISLVELQEAEAGMQDKNKPTPARRERVGREHLSLLHVLEAKSRAIEACHKTMDSLKADWTSEHIDAAR
jgi:hypothetical protein